MTDSIETDLEVYERLLDTVFDDEMLKLTEQAERTQRFPRELIEWIGRAGLFEHKWRDGHRPDVAKLFLLSEDRKSVV